LLQNMPGIPSDLAAQMRQAAEAQQSAGESLQSMAQSLQQMAQDMAQEGMSQDAQQAMESMAEQLSQMEMSQQESESFQAAMNEIQSQIERMGQDPCQNGCTGECGGSCEGGGEDGGGGGQDGKGKGAEGEGDSMAVGPGIGTGGEPGSNDNPEIPLDYILDKRKSTGENTGGPTIGSTLVYGDQIRGDSVAQFEAATTAARAEAAEAIETRRIPREYEKAIQHYFGRLEARAKAKRAAEGAGASGG